MRALQEGQERCLPLEGRTPVMVPKPLESIQLPPHCTQFSAAAAPTVAEDIERWHTGQSLIWLPFWPAVFTAGDMKLCLCNIEGRGGRILASDPVHGNWQNVNNIEMNWDCVHGAPMMEEVETAKAPPIWKSFLVGLLLLTMVLAPICGMVLYFSPLAAKLNWYGGATMPFGFALGFGASIVLAAIFAMRASR
jgi:hypothetical protein